MSARPFTEAEYTRLLEHFAGPKRTRERLLLVLGCGTGYRIQELLRITWRQVLDGDQIARELTVERRHLKGGHGLRLRSVRNRRVPLSESVRAALQEHLTASGKVEPDHPIFATRSGAGKAMDRSHAFRLLQGAAIACGLPADRISTHSLRKTFVARIYAASGHDLIKTQRIVGHSSPLTTARYLETDSAELDRLVLNIAA